MIPAAEQLLRGALATLARMRGAAAGAARTMIEVALSLEHSQPAAVPAPAPAGKSRSEQARAAALARWGGGGRMPRASPEHAPRMPRASPEHDASLSLFSSDLDPKRESGAMPTLLERVVLEGDRMPAELEQLAEREGVRDVARSWRRFCVHHAGKTLEVARAWRLWVLGERDRAPPGARASPREDIAVRERQARDAHEELRRERAGPGLVRASVAEVLAKLGPPPSPACAS